MAKSFDSFKCLLPTTTQKCFCLDCGAGFEYGGAVLLGSQASTRPRVYRRHETRLQGMSDCQSRIQGEKLIN